MIIENLVASFETIIGSISVQSDNQIYFLSFSENDKKYQTKLIRAIV